MLSTALGGVMLARADRNLSRRPVLYEPSVFVVVSGQKTGYIGERKVVYDQNHYLILGIPLPFECETTVAHNGPLLGASIRMDLSVVRELAALIPLANGAAIAHPAYIEATPLNLGMSSAVVRLLECLRSDIEAAVLGPGIMREIAYHAICGPQGGALLAMIAQGGSSGQIRSALHRMHTQYAEPLNITQIAEEVGMSVSAFHHRFKSATASSPLQYLKAIRLHKARLLILHDGLGAALAADRVGYESASQFSREFKRFFGNGPMEESRRVRGTKDVSDALRIEAESA